MVQQHYQKDSEAACLTVEKGLDMVQAVKEYMLSEPDAVACETVSFNICGV